MIALFRPLIERVKALFAVSAAQELEADLLLRDAERRAELLRQAERYEEEGLHGIAQHLRQQAEQVSVQRPLAAVLPALAHLQTGLADTPDTPELPAPDNGALPGLDAPPPPQALPAPRKKGGRK
jgi:hypothetical protein